MAAPTRGKICADEVEAPQPNDWPANIYEIMSSACSVPEWEAWVSPFRPQQGQHALGPGSTAKGPFK